MRFRLTHDPASLPSVVLNSNFRQAIPQCIPRKPEQTRGLRLVATRTLQRFADHFVFPLVEGHAVGEEAVAIRCRVVAIARRIELYVADFQLAALGEGAGAFDDVLQFPYIAWPIMTDQELHGSG